jgi:hypothetical protein
VWAKIVKAIGRYVRPLPERWGSRQIVQQLTPTGSRQIIEDSTQGIQCWAIPAEHGNSYFPIGMIRMLIDLIEFEPGKEPSSGYKGATQQERSNDPRRTLQCIRFTRR